MNNKSLPFPAASSALILQGAAGRLETLVSVPKPAQKLTTVVICHPHPLFGGAMHNKVVFTLARAFDELGMRTVRFNFRGVGKSEGSYAEGIGETDDLLAILQWLRAARPQDTIWLAGFSFGAYVAARGAHRWPTAQLICVAPPIENFKFTELYPFPCPWLLVQGEEDEIVSAPAVINWATNLPEPPRLLRIANTGHFFHGHLIELRRLLIENLAQEKITPP
jgi:alpha/beta superfamily hydrolase